MRHHIARKRFGQHFLVDEAVIDRIVRAIDPLPDQNLCEIGPGTGALTRPLLDACRRLTVIEVDRDLARRARAWTGVTVIEADVLGVDFGALARPAIDDGALGTRPAGARNGLRVVGNLPYNISTPLLFHLCNFADVVEDQHFMLQREVVERLVAAPCTASYGRLSVMLQCRYEMEHLFDVPPWCFDPPPAVDSAVVRMRASGRAIDADLVRTLGLIVTSAFSQRRKIMRHTLGRWLSEHGVDAPFDVHRRAEEVSVDEFLRLATTANAANLQAAWRRG
jgi:16S rRNA (adenine1518-N6/adenine1519-N6)-dimethyltransferase